MAWLFRMAGLRDLRRDDGVSDLPTDVLGDGMSDLTLEYQLKQLNERHMEYAAGLHAKIEKLERELDQWRMNYGKLGLELATEKALADGTYNAWKSGVPASPTLSVTDYRKARGLE